MKSTDSKLVFTLDLFAERELEADTLGIDSWSTWLTEPFSDVIDDLSALSPVFSFTFSDGFSSKFSSKLSSELSFELDVD